MKRLTKCGQHCDKHDPFYGEHQLVSQSLLHGEEVREASSHLQPLAGDGQEEKALQFH
jgi:hypothetical protein